MNRVQVGLDGRERILESGVVTGREGGDKRVDEGLEENHVGVELKKEVGESAAG